MKIISAPRSWSHENTVVLILRDDNCFHLTNSEVTWVLVYSGTQVQSHVILDPGYLPEYFSFSYD